jgi:hypothetical protein
VEKDKLFLLRPGFTNTSGGPFYCGDSAPVEGVLSFFPQLRELLEVQYLEFPRPRQALVDQLGVDNQSLPALVLAPGRQLAADVPAPQSAQGRLFFSSERAIRDYLAIQYGLPRPG